MNIWLISDTGYFISDDSGALRDRVGSYAKAEVSGSKVAFLFYRKWDGQFDQFKRNKDEVRRFLEDGGELSASLLNGGVRGKCYDFSRLSDESSADRLIEELVNWSNDNGFPLERVKKVG